MTASKIICASIVRLRRTIMRTLRHISIVSTTLTISFPPFIKLEIKTKPRLVARRRQRRVA